MKQQWKKPRSNLRGKGSTMARSYVAKKAAAARAANRRGNLRGRARRVIRKPTIQASGGVVTSSSFRMIKRGKTDPRVTAIKRVGSPNIYVNQVPKTIITSAGFLNYWSMFHQYNTDLRNIRQLINSSSAAPIRYVLENYMNEMTMTNTTNASCEVEIYDLTLKKDLLVQFAYEEAANTYVVNGSPEAYWEVGTRLMSGQADAVSPPNSTVLGASPFDSQLFKDYFKVQKRTRVMLSQGASHRHFVTLNVNKVIDDAFVQTSQQIIGHKGITVYTMLVVRGFPQTTGNVEDPGVSTTCPCQLAIVNQQRYKYTWSADLSNTGNYYDQLTSPATTAVLNIGSGLVDTFAKTN